MEYRYKGLPPLKKFKADKVMTMGGGVGQQVQEPIKLAFPHPVRWKAE